MAIDIFSIPAMSSKGERVFSEVQHTITNKRSSSKIGIIEALECLKSWFRAEIFTHKGFSEASYQQPREA